MFAQKPLFYQTLGETVEIIHHSIGVEIVQSNLLEMRKQFDRIDVLMLESSYAIFNIGARPPKQFRYDQIIQVQCTDEKVFPPVQKSREKLYF